MHNSTYYGNGVYEPIKIIDAHKLNFNLGNVIKYTLRAGKKDGESKLKDLHKALDYVSHEIELLEQEEENVQKAN